MSDESGNGPRLPPPVRRSYAPILWKRRSTDAFELAIRVRTFLFSLIGAFLGLLLGVFASAMGSGGGLVIMLCTFVGWASVYFGPLALASMAGRAGSTLYAPSGRSTPRKKEYSLAESYVVRGEYAAAVEAFEAAILEDPSEPAPYLRIARIRRDLMADLNGSAEGFRRALVRSTMEPGIRLLALKEMVELCEVRLGDPLRAAPLLARAAEEHAASRDGVWAAQELARIRSAMADDTATG